MKLYYTPGACSLAAHISLREAGLSFDLVKVDIGTKKLEDGSDFTAVNPKGYVPALRLDNAEVLTENGAILQYIGDRNPGAQLLPAAGTLERYRVIEWISFINSEIHKAYSPLFYPTPDDVKSFARGNLTNRLGWLNGALGSKKYLTGEPFTVADAYLFVVLSWGAHVGVDIGQWPNLKRLQETAGARPRVLEALKAEGLIK
jgi:glutathione S-transferase